MYLLADSALQPARVGAVPQQKIDKRTGSVLIETPIDFAIHGFSFHMVAIDLKLALRPPVEETRSLSFGYRFGRVTRSHRIYVCEQVDRELERDVSQLRWYWDEPLARSTPFSVFST